MTQMKEIYINDIRVGDKINDTFMVVEKNMAVSQKGSPYLTLRLKDKTGEIEGRVWDNAIELNKLFNKGDVIHIRSRAINYRNAIQLAIQEVRKVDDAKLDPRDFLPTSGSNTDRMFEDLMEFVEKVKTPCLKELLYEFFEDEHGVNQFKKAPAAKGLHHAYIGGLLEHTLSVTRLIDMAADLYGGVNRDLLITGGILHDIGKIHELSFDRMIDYTDKGRLVGHIVIGVEMLDAKIAKIENFPEQLAMELRHILLSHHGILEYGSPKRPKTLEALIVHYIDDLDAKVNAFREFMDKSNDDSDWTPFHRLFERFIYKGKVSS